MASVMTRLMSSMTRLDASPTRPAASYTPALPVETWSHIIRLSLPQRPSPSNDFAERSAALRSYTLVSLTWRDFAQKELFARPTIRVGRQIAGFLETLKARPALRAVVRGVALGRCKWPVGDRRDAVGIEEILATCTELDEVHMYGLKNVRLSWLVTAQALHKLVFYDVSLAPRENLSDDEVKILLPRLRHLSFREVHYGPAAIPTLVLPALSMVSLHALSFLPEIAGVSRDNPLVISLDWESTPVVSPCPTHRHLIALWRIREPADLRLRGEQGLRGSAAISHMRYISPSPNAFWRSRNSDSESLGTLSATLKGGAVPALAGLRSLYLQAAFKGEDKIAELLEVCREHGVAVIYEGSHPLGLDDSEVLEEFARAQGYEGSTVDGTQI